MGDGPGGVRLHGAAEALVLGGEAAQRGANSRRDEVDPPSLV